MKTDARAQTEPRTRIKRLLDMLRIQAEHLQDLAAKTTDYNELAVPAEEADHRLRLSRR
jgi:hypothetical protein